MYWKLHDRPSKSNNSHRSWKPNNGQQQKGQGHANFTSSNQTNNENEIQEHGEFKFKKEDIERLKSLFESLEKPPNACSSESDLLGPTTSPSRLASLSTALSILR